MTTPSLARRLGRIEAQRPHGGGSFFLVWARSDMELREAAEAYRDMTKPDELVGAVWPFDEPHPASRWVGDEGLADRELEALSGSFGGAALPTTKASTAALGRMTDAQLTSAVLAAPDMDLGRVAR